MSTLSCLCCSACFLDAVGPLGWRDGCGVQMARCIGTGTAWQASDGEARRVQDGGDWLGRRGRRPRRAQARWQGAHAASRPGPRRRAQSPFGHAAAAWRKARSARPQAAAAERPRGAGNIFTPCVISGPSTRKRALGGKIRAPCIPNRPIAPGNGCIGRRCCHLDLEKHAFRADAARRRASLAHSAKRGCMRCDSCQPGPWDRRNARGGRGWRCAMSAGRGRRREAGLGNRGRLCASVGRSRQRWGAA